MQALRYLVPLAWTAVVARLSGEGWSAAGTSFLIPLLAVVFPTADPDQLRAGLWLVRKLAHVVEYAVLAALWWWALPRAGYRWPVALALAVLTASLDELHQASTATRTGSARDVLLDAAGASAALALLHWGRVGIERLTGAILWAAAVGGTALIALNWLAMAPSGWLWISVPAAWVALVLWRRRPRDG